MDQILIEKEQSEKTIKFFAAKVMRRLYSAGDKGRNFSLEDIQQELRIAWLKASETFDAEHGVPFQAYLTKGMRQHINRLLEKQIGRRHQEVLAQSLDTPIGHDDGGSSSLHNIVPDENQKVGLDYEDDQHFEYVTRNLKPRSKIFIKLLRDQPKELLIEVDMMRKRFEFGREQFGINSPPVNRLAASVIFDLMDASHAERADIIKEIRAVGQRVTEAMTQ